MMDMTNRSTHLIQEVSQTEIQSKFNLSLHAILFQATCQIKMSFTGYEVPLQNPFVRIKSSNFYRIEDADLGEFQYSVFGRPERGRQISKIGGMSEDECIDVLRSSDNGPMYDSVQVYQVRDRDQVDVRFGEIEYFDGETT